MQRQGKTMLRFVGVLLAAWAVLASAGAKPDTDVKTNVWVVKLRPEADPFQVAERHGLENMAQLGVIPDFYMFHLVQEDLATPRMITSALLPHNAHHVQRVEASMAADEDVLYVRHQVQNKVNKQRPLTAPPPQLEMMARSRDLDTQPVISRTEAAEYAAARDNYQRPDDVLFPNQWHLENNGDEGASSTGTKGADCNVLPAWDAGFTGKQIVIGIVDDGIECGHPDMACLPSSSWNFLTNEAVNDGTPPTSANYHGTACAGLAAARRDGVSCGVGVAYDAQVFSAVVEDSVSTASDAQRALALVWKLDVAHIYSNSWGPEDSGDIKWTLPTELSAALETGIKTGRDGKGAIYVWAGGNGNLADDRADYDGWMTSRYTIGIAAIDWDAFKAIYSENGACVLGASFGGNLAGQAGLRTTDLQGTAGADTNNGVTGDCNNNFWGTSAAAPVVAGTIGLVLEANPSMTWRDVQHLLMRTARRSDVPNDPSWQKNKAGVWHSESYGFGLIDAQASTSFGRKENGWESVVPYLAIDSGTLVEEIPIEPGGYNGITTVFQAARTTQPEDFYIDHVEVWVKIDAPARGELAISLTSPSGTVATFAGTHGDVNSNYHGIGEGIQFLSLRSWGEIPDGRWELNVADRVTGNPSALLSWRIVIHGIKSPEDRTPAILWLIAAAITAVFLLGAGLMYYLMTKNRTDTHTDGYSREGRSGKSRSQYTEAGMETGDGRYSQASGMTNAHKSGMTQASGMTNAHKSGMTQMSGMTRKSSSGYVQESQMTRAPSGKYVQESQMTRGSHGSRGSGGHHSSGSRGSGAGHRSTGSRGSGGRSSGGGRRSAGQGRSSSVGSHGSRGYNASSTNSRGSRASGGKRRR